jgi:hypothetical protein
VDCCHDVSRRGVFQEEAARARSQPSQHLVVGVKGLPAQWLSLLDTTTRLLGEEMTGQAWAQIATSFAMWSLLPLLLGAVRVQRREIQ